ITLPALIANRAVEGVVDQEELQNALPGLGHLGGVGPDHHPLPHPLAAGGDQLPGPFHLHQADPADRHGIQLVVRAEDGNLHARLARRIEHQGSRRHLHGPAVDGEADPLAAHAERTSRTWQAPRSMWARYSSSKWMRVELRKPTEASEKGQMVRPAICPGRLFKTSRSSGRP